MTTEADMEETSHHPVWRSASADGEEMRATEAAQPSPTLTESTCISQNPLAEKVSNSAECPRPGPLPTLAQLVRSGRARLFSSQRASVQAHKPVPPPPQSVVRKRK